MCEIDTKNAFIFRELTMYLSSRCSWCSSVWSSLSSVCVSELTTGETTHDRRINDKRCIREDTTTGSQQRIQSNSCAKSTKTGTLGLNCQDWPVFQTLEFVLIQEVQQRLQTITTQIYDRELTNACAIPCCELVVRFHFLLVSAGQALRKLYMYRICGR